MSFLPRRALVLALCIVGLNESASFHYISQPSFLSAGASPALISRARVNEILCPRTASTKFALRMALDQATVDKFVQLAASGPAVSTKATKVAKALKKASGAIAIALEYSLDLNSPIEKMTNLMQSNLDVGMKADTRLYSMMMRKEKVSALFVDGSTPEGLNELQEIANEQTIAKGSFPGPIPVVRSGRVDTIAHVAEAKAAGADGVVVAMQTPAAAELIKACVALGMEAVAAVRDAAQVEAAVAAGAGIICVDVPDPAAGQALRSVITKDKVAVGAVDARQQGGPAVLKGGEEAGEPLVLLGGGAYREAKFDALLAQRACIHTQSKQEVSYSRWLSSELQSKRSSSFAHISKGASLLGSGRPPVQPEGFHTRLE